MEEEKRTVQGGRPGAAGWAERLLTQPGILGWILQGCCWEYEYRTPGYIADRCIVNRPEPGRSFDPLLPEGMESRPLRVEVTLDAPDTDTPENPVDRRLNRRCMEMLAEQSEGRTEEEALADLHKAYSIWVCPDAPEERSPGMVRYSVTMTTYRDGRKVKEEEARGGPADLLGGTVIRPGDGSCLTGNGMVDLLGMLFSGADAGEKIRQLGEVYGIAVTEEMAEEVEAMTDQLNRCGWEDPA